MDFAFRSHPLVVGADAEVIEEWEAQMTGSTYADGEVIVEQGDTEAGVFLVMSGRVRQSIVRAGATSRNIATLTPGMSFGDVSVATGSPHPMTVTAEGDVRVSSLTRERFAEVRETDPALYAALLGVFMHAVHDEQARMLAVIAGTRAAEPVTA